MASDPAKTHGYLSRLPVAERLGVYAVHQAIAENLTSEARPLWRLCPGYALVLAEAPLAGCPSRDYAPQPAAGREIRFDLLADVSVARKKEGFERSRRVDPVLEARIAEPGRSYEELARAIGCVWLGQRAAKHGFDILEIERTDYEPLEFVRKGSAIRIPTIRFTGRLRVTDADAFRKAMLCGIGHSKAWGCGLLLCFGH